MNPPNFTSSSVTEDPENIVDELQKMFEKSKAEGAPIMSWDVFEEAFVGRFFSRELREEKVEKDKLRDESGQQKSNANRSYFQQKSNGPAPSSASAPAPRNKCEFMNQNSQTFRARPAQSQVALPYRAEPRGATSGTSGRENRLYAITSGQEKDNSHDVVLGMIKVFTFNVYALLDLGASLYFVTSYIAMRFHILPE
uniref:Gag-pol polyprotein n=1 Tax=Solanum tuberosum TaxID=4113 RepID=M1DYZ0_SOLTU